MGLKRPFGGRKEKLISLADNLFAIEYEVTVPGQLLNRPAIGRKLAIAAK
ncbi:MULTISPECIES: hypothetical protein [Microcoleaceae]|nr:hypothetical protein [Tychonema sp. LEGE 06208]MBE9163642.1 hypothetical protein [Tychonema sp. LEGE 06208]